MVMPEMPRIIKIFICHNNSLMVQTQTHRYEGAKIVRSPGSGEYIYIQSRRGVRTAQSQMHVV